MPMPRFCRYLAVLFLVLVSPLGEAARAQDTHWWNLRYGTEAEFLGGALVGSAVGLSNTFYNPGALSLIEKPQLFTTALAAEYAQLRIDNPRNAEKPYSWSTLGSSPTLIAGLFLRDTASGRLWGYSYLTRQKFKFEIASRVIDTSDVIPAPPGTEDLAAELLSRQDSEEIWVGLTHARRPREGLGAGITLYGAYRSQRSRFQTLAQVVVDTLAGASATLITDYSYWATRVLAKGGVTWRTQPWTLGLTLTTASLDLFGDGWAFYNLSVIHVDIDGDGIPDNELGSNYQEGLSTAYKSPWSLAFGFSHRRGRSTFHASAEWFGKVANYTVMEPEPFRIQSSGDTTAYALTHAARSVIDWGLGIEHRASQYVVLYAGFAADYSAYSGQSSGSINISQWDIYHASFGSQFRFSSIDFTMGLTASFGSEQIPVETGPLEEPQMTDARYLRLKLLFGFTLPT